MSETNMGGVFLCLMTVFLLALITLSTAYLRRSEFRRVRHFAEDRRLRGSLLSTDDKRIILVRHGIGMKFELCLLMLISWVTAIGWSHETMGEFPSGAAIGEYMLSSEGIVSMFLMMLVIAIPWMFTILVLNRIVLIDSEGVFKKGSLNGEIFIRWTEVSGIFMRRNPLFPISIHSENGKKIHLGARNSDYDLLGEFVSRYGVKVTKSTNKGNQLGNLLLYIDSRKESGHDETTGSLRKIKAEPKHPSENRYKIGEGLIFLSGVFGILNGLYYCDPTGFLPLRPFLGNDLPNEIILPGNMSDWGLFFLMCGAIASATVFTSYMSKDRRYAIIGSFFGMLGYAMPCFFLALIGLLLLMHEDERYFNIEERALLSEQGSKV